MTFLGTTLAGLGLTLGTYIYKWDTTDSFVLNIGTTPLPATLPPFATGLRALGLFGWRRKRKARPAVA